MASSLEKLDAALAEAEGPRTGLTIDDAGLPPGQPTGQMAPGGAISPDVLNRLNAAIAGQAPAEPETGGFNQRAGSVATGFNDTIAALAGAIPDLGTFLGNTFGRGVNAVAGREIIPPATSYGGGEMWRKATEATVGRTEPKDDLDRLLYGAGAGVAGVPVGGAVGSGLALGGAIPKAVGAALTGPRTVSGQVGNTAINATGGFGGALGEQAAGEDPAARAVGNVVGGVALPVGAVGLGAGAFNYGRNLLGPLLPGAVGAREAERGAARQLHRAVGSDPLSPQLDYSDTELVPGSRPSLGQATGDPRLQRLESNVVGRLPGDPEDWTRSQRFLAETANDQSRARGAVPAAIGDPNADISATQTTAKQRLAEIDAERDRLLLQARGKAEQEYSGLGPRQFPEERGGGINREIDTALKANDEAEAAAWQAIDPTGRAKMDVSGVANAATRIEKEMLPATAKPPTGEEAAIFEMAKGLGVLPFTEVQGLRHRLLQAIRDERDASGKSPSHARMEKLRAALDDEIDAAAQPGSQLSTADAASVARYRSAQGITREQKDVWGNTVIDPLIAKESGGRVTLDTNVVGKVLENFETATMAVRAGMKPETLRGALIDDLSRHVGGAEVLTQAKLDSWLKTREGALRAVPGLKEELARAADAQTLVEGVQTGQIAERKAFERSRVAKFLDVENPADLQAKIGTMMQSSDAASEMMRLRKLAAGDPAAEAGLVRAVADWVGDTFVKQTTGEIKPDMFLKFLKQKEGALQAAGVPSDGIDRLRAVAEDMLRGPAPGTATTVGANRTGTPSSSPNIFQRMMAAAKNNKDASIGYMGVFGAGALAAAAGDIPTAGMISAATIPATAAAQWARRLGNAKIDQVLADMIINPQYGRAMLMKDAPENLKFVEPALRAVFAAELHRNTVGYDYEKAGGRKRPAR